MSKKEKNRNEIGRIAGLVGIIANILLASGKLIVGIISASVSIIADALNNFSDCVSSVITMIGFKLAQKPADADHPYGHARFEYISSFIVSILVLLVGIELAQSSVEKIFNPEAVKFSIVTALVLIASIVVKIILSIYNASVAKRIDSSTLKATAIDARNDAIMTTAVLAATLIEHFTTLKIDGYAGLLVALFILYSGIMLTKETISPILGMKNDAALRDRIIEKINEYPEVIGYHDLMIHDYGPGISFSSIHFEIDRAHDPLYIHELIDKFEREFSAEGINLTVHYDPVVTDSAELNALKYTVTKSLVAIDERLTLHDFRSIPCDGFTKLFFDVPLPEELEGKENDIKAMIEKDLNRNSDTKYQAEITFDPVAFN